MTRRILTPLLALLALPFLPACASDPARGYSFTPAHSQDVQTVAVPIFENPTFSRGVEVELTDAIIKEIQRSTPWRVTDQSAAQTVLTGAITDSSMRRLSVQRDTGLAQEIAVILTVDFTWKDARTGRTLVARRSFTASEPFVPANPVRERLETGQHATIQQLAKDIVDELRSNW